MRSGRIVSLAGAAAAVATLVTAAPAAASSVVPAVDRTCYSGYFCVYRDSGFSTANSMYRFSLSDNDWKDHEPLIYHADSSWKNLNSKDAYVCDDGWITTNTIHLKNGESISYSSAANDRGVMNAWSNCS